MITIKVRGKPAPQGSKTRNRYGAIYEDSAAVKPWREAIRTETQREVDEPLHGPVIVRAMFLLPRPKGHYRTGRYADQLRPSAPQWHFTKPDLDKLTRAVLDGLSDGGAWTDDAQVCALDVQKSYGPPGCLIQIEEATHIPRETL